MDVTVFVLVSCYFIAVLNTAECVVFEINDYDLNRVVFIGESNIVLTCSAPEFNNPQFLIIHQSNIIIDSRDNFVITTFTKSIEVEITQVQAFHGGIYQCLVAGDGPLTLTLDVRSGNSLSCPQSSETLNVNEGEILTLFCYFLWNLPSGAFTPYDFIWQEKSEPNPVPLNNSTVTQSPSFVKGIVIAFVGPFTADDDNTVYECSHLIPSISGAAPCSVGPVTVTPRLTDPTSQTPTQQPVTIPATSTPIRISTKASFPSTTNTNWKTLNITIGPAKNTPTATASPVQKDVTEELMKNSTKKPAVNNNNIVVILLSIVVIILAIVITVLLCHKSQSKRNKRKEMKKEKSEFQLRGHPASNSIQGKDEDGYLEPNPQFINHISGRSDVGVAMATGSSSMIGLHHDYEHEIIGIKNKQDDPSYEEVNHHSWNVKTLHMC